MGMLDEVLGGVLGRRGSSGQSPGGGGGINKVLLLLLAAGAAKVWMDRRSGGSAQTAPGSAPSQGGGGLGDILGSVLGGGSAGGRGAPGGGLGDILGGALGGGRSQPGSGGLGSLITGAGGMGGLGALIEQFNRNGHGSTMNQWVSTGANPPLPPQQLAEALGPDLVDDLARESGMDKQQMLTELSDVLPEAVDKLTPDGTLPPPETLQTKKLGEF